MCAREASGTHAHVGIDDVGAFAVYARAGSALVDVDVTLRPRVATVADTSVEIQIFYALAKDTGI